jgi:NitT/TauT family transport system substrate-binding protein
MTLTTRPARWMAVLLAVSLLVAACAPEPPEEPEAEPDVEEPEPEVEEPEPEVEEPEPELKAVSLRLPWFPSTQFAGEYVALEKGYFADEGLDVTINPGGFDINSIVLVGVGTDTFGLHDTGSLLFAHVEQIPLITVATFLQKHPGAILALEESGFETLDDLVGARIGFQEGGPWQLTQAMLVKNGIEPDSLDQVAVGFDLTPLFQGDIDLLTVFATNEPILAELQGFDVTVFSPYDYGIETSANALFTRQDYMEENPDTVCGMVRAIAKGWEYAFDNPEEAVDIVVAVDPRNLDAEKEALSLEAITEHVLTPDAIANGIGWMSHERWETADSVLRDFGGLTAEIDLDSVYTTACFD